MVEETLTLDEESEDSSTDRQSKIVEVGDTEVVVRETDDGFEVEEAELDPLSERGFEEKTGYYVGKKFGTSNVDRIEILDENEVVKIWVSDASYDLVDHQFFETVQENGYFVTLVEFEHGYMKLRYEEEFDQHA